VVRFAGGEKLVSAVDHGLVSRLQTPRSSRDAGLASPNQSLDQLYETYAPLVAGWIGRLLGPQAEIEDLVHDTFLVAYRRQGDFRGEASLKTWLFGITENLVANRRKRDRVRRWLFDRFSKDSRALQSPSVEPLEDMVRRERVVRLYRALDKLPDIYRTAVILFEIDGVPGQEIAELMGVDVETLWVRLHRGRAKLLTLMQKEGQP
jgi:RNA polymerase sigma-70 factor, ECF subfamily